MKLIRYLVPLFLLFSSVAYAAPDYSKPNLSSGRDVFAGEVRENVNACTKIDPTGGTSIPEGAIWFDYANGLLKRYESSVWTNKPVTVSDGSITSAKILDGTIATADIADSNVTEAKLADDAASRSAPLISSYVLAGNGTGAAAVILRNFSVSVTRLSMPKAGKVTHLSINIQQPLTSGTLTMGIYKNGVDSGQTVVMTGGASVVDRTAALGSPVSFVAGDYLEVTYSTSSAVFTSGTSQGIYQAWGHFTE